ncbi:hypothetical protein ACJJTC_017989 [Scirpophaga incertulas]
MTTPLPKLQPPRVTQGVDPMNTKASNLPLEWKNWLMKFNIYLKAYSLDKEPDDRQVAILLHFMGQDCLTIFNSFNFDVNTVKLEELTKKFTHYFSPKVNITMERHKLFNRKQRLHEDLDNYVTDLRNIALQCNFGNLHDSLLKDIFSWNLNDSNYYIKEKLLQEMPKTLDAAINIAKSLEMSREQAKIFTSSEHPVIGKVSQSYSSQSRSPSHSKSQSQSRSHSPARNYSQAKSPSQSWNNMSNSNSSASGRVNNNICHKCGQVHRTRCPAQGVKCTRCGKFNHYARMCRNKTVNVVLDTSYTEENSMFMGSIQCNNVIDPGNRLS